MGQDISSQDRVTFHALCTVCRRVCGQSRILNDQNYFHHLADQWIKIEEGDSRFPLRECFPDPSQWNDSLLYIFEEEAPHHLSSAALQASAIAGCHLCNLFWNYVSLERFGILKEEEDMETKQLAEASRSKAREQLLATSEPLFVRVGIEQNYDAAEVLIINVGVTGTEHNAAIVLYAGRHDHLPDLRSTLNVWPTKVVQGYSVVCQSLSAS